jgi:hypothetical protein
VHAEGRGKPTAVKNEFMRRETRTGFCRYDETMNIFSYVIAFQAGAGRPGLASPVWSALFVYVSGIIG